MQTSSKKGRLVSHLRFPYYFEPSFLPTFTFVLHVIMDVLGGFSMSMGFAYSKLESWIKVVALAEYGGTILVAVNQSQHKVGLHNDIVLGPQNAII
jgi:hypothetical protein